MSLDTGAYKVGGDGKALARGMRYPWQPWSGLKQALPHLTVQWNTY